MRGEALELIVEIPLPAIHYLLPITSLKKLKQQLTLLDSGAISSNNVIEITKINSVPD